MPTQLLRLLLDLPSSFPVFPRPYILEMLSATHRSALGSNPATMPAAASSHHCHSSSWAHLGLTPMGFCAGTTKSLPNWLGSLQIRQQTWLTTWSNGTRHPAARPSPPSASRETRWHSRFGHSSCGRVADSINHSVFSAIWSVPHTKGYPIAQKGGVGSE